MLIQSTENDFYLLPALPRDKWVSGSVKGLKARGNVTVSVSWNNGDLHEISLLSPDNSNLDVAENQSITKTIHYREISVVVKMPIGKVYTFDKHLKSIKTTSLLHRSDT